MKPAILPELTLCTALVLGAACLAQDETTTEATAETPTEASEEAAVDVKAELQAAVEALAKAGNYSWTQSMTFGNREPRTSSGKLGSGGHVRLTMPGRDGDFEVILRGERAVMMRDGAWEKVEEPAAGEDRWRGFFARMIRNFEAPTTELGGLVEKLDAVEKGPDGSYTATLGEEAARGLMSFGRRGRGRDGGGGFEPPTVEGAGGSVTFTVSDGVLTRYVTELSGSMNFNGENRDVSRSTSVGFSEVGSTTFELPEAAVGMLYDSTGS